MSLSLPPTTIQCFGLPAVLGFWVSYVLVSSLTTLTSISTSTLMSPISTLTLSTLRWTPFVKVAISTLVLRNIISAPCASLPSIYMSVAQLLAHISFSLRHPSKLTMTDIWYSIHPLRFWGPWLLHRSYLLHWHSYFSSLLWLTRSPHQDA